MKWKGIFKLWHFWLFVILYTILRFLKQVNEDGWFALSHYPVYSAILVFGFLLTLLIYSIMWLIFGRDKKQKE